MEYVDVISMISCGMWGFVVGIMSGHYEWTTSKTILISICGAIFLSIAIHLL